MSQRAMMQGMDAAIMSAFMGVGMADAATYTAPQGAPIPCGALVDRAAQFLEDRDELAGRRVVVTLFLSQVASPVRGARVELKGGEAFTLDIRVESDESRQRWVVIDG